MNVLIIGAGPTGLTAALELTRLGVVPEIIDAKDAPSPMSRAVGIMPGSIEILNRTGVGERVVEEGVKFGRVHIQKDAGTLIDVDVAQFFNKKDFLIGLPQDRTESLMSERLEEMGVHVQYGVRAVSVETREREVGVVFENGKEKTYDWVIGADGVHSTVRESLSILYNGYELDEEWSIADVELEDGYEEVVRAWLLDGDRGEKDVMVMIPIAKNRVRLVSSTPDSCAALPLKLAVKTVRRSGTFKISVRQAAEYVKGRVLLAGDAAHAHSPVGGRGMNLGIDDGRAAAAAIVKGSVNEYELERKKIARKVIRSTEFVRTTLVSKNIFVSTAVRAGAWLTQHSPFLQKKFVMRVMRF